MKKFLFSLFVVAGTLAFATNANAQNHKKQNCCKTQKECCQEAKACCDSHKTDKACCQDMKACCDTQKATKSCCKGEKATKQCCKSHKHQAKKNKACCSSHKHKMHKLASVEKRVERHMTFVKETVDINSKEATQLASVFSKYEKQRDEHRKTMDAKKVDVDKMTREQRRAFHKTQRNLRETKRDELHKEITVILGEKRAEKFIGACEARFKTQRKNLRMEQRTIEAPSKEEEMEPMEDMPIVEDF